MVSLNKLPPTKVSPTGTSLGYKNWIRIRYLKLLLKTQHKIGLQNRQLKPGPVQSLSFLKKDPDSSTESFLAPRGPTQVSRDSPGRITMGSRNRPEQA